MIGESSGTKWFADQTPPFCRPFLSDCGARLHPQQQNTFLRLLGNYDVINDVIIRKLRTSIYNGAHLKRENWSRYSYIDRLACYRAYGKRSSK